MAKKKKYYVVWQGHEPGIYDSWAACLQQTKNYPGARFKGFESRAAAEAAFGGHAGDYIGSRAPLKSKPQPSLIDAPIIWESIAVDAACSGNPGLMEYRGVDTKTGTELFRQGPFAQGTNNVGEFLALVHGLAMLQKEGRNVPIYSDSRIAIGWVKKKAPKTQLQRTAANAQLFDLMERAVKWLKTHTYDTQILKWETKAWGEIPADFGRK